MFLQPFANMSFKLHPLAVGWDTSKNIQQGVVFELLFHTALQIIQFSIGFFINISCKSGSFLICYSQTFIAFTLCGFNLIIEFYNKGKSTMQYLSVRLTYIDLLMISCLISSPMLVTLIFSLFFKSLQYLQLNNIGNLFRYHHFPFYQILFDS